MNVSSSSSLTVKSCKVFLPGQKLRLTAKDLPGDCFVLLYGRGKGLLLTLDKDRLLHDSNDFGYAVADETLMVDTVDRPGIGIISLPETHWVNKAAAIHDYQTSCKAYMLAYGRSEAERQLREHLDMIADTVPQKIFGRIISALSNAFSWYFWDVPETRWKLGRTHNATLCISPSSRSHSRCQFCARPTR